MAGVLDQLLAPGGTPPAAAPADLPPSIPDPGAAAAGATPPATPAATPDAVDAPNSEVGVLKEMLGLVDAYKGIPTVTEQERAQAEKVGTILQSLLASNEKMSDQVTGATPALRKAYGGGG
jgi:hypothetical protein